ncbi:MAG: hypothetical protein A2104_09195 [Candidatus Melainabacteria bacterium GWF2_32_7]|nr:MAG: hypothetical protein A2104_09195 [Candidatus Melainabacteria bacterium GWF2_32_7]
MIYDKSQLTELFRNGCKSRENFRIGLEFEKLAVDSKNHKAVPYSGEKGIQDFLARYKDFMSSRHPELAAKQGEPESRSFMPLSGVSESKTLKQVQGDDNNNLLGLKGDFGYISLEPGSQTEISTYPYKDINEIASEIQVYNQKTAIIGDELGINWIGYGIQPVSTFDSIKIIPKKRYEIMTDYLPAKGDKALVMMRETAGIQASIDYESEEDAMNKLRVSLAISPIITAMFANSPIRGGKETGYKSYRASSWLKTDNDRCGLISKKIFESDFSFDDYAQYLLDVPMFFIERNDTIINATHLTFKEFLNKGLTGFKATIDDWDIHMSTVFPDVRLRNYIEIRNCDSQRSNLILALPTLIKGIMYNEDALNQVWDLVKDFSWSELQEMRHSVPKFGLETTVKGINVADLAKELVNIAEFSLLSSHAVCHSERSKESADPSALTRDDKKNEAIYLEKLKELVQEEKTPADIILKNWNDGWNRDIKKLIEYSKLN